MKNTLLKKAFAELIGTYALVTAGCGAIIVNSLTNNITHLGVAFTFGLVIMAMISACGHISGAHFNPAVTIAFAFTRHFSWKNVPVYIGSQLIGAILGSWTLLSLFGNIARLGATIPSGSVSQSFGLEVLLTGVLMYVVMAVATDTNAVGEMAAIAIGATVGFEGIWGGPISGASMNPARSLGPALVSGAISGQWIYIIAPILGACIGAWIYQLVRLPQDK